MALYAPRLPPPPFRYSTDQTFTQVQESDLNAMSVIDGNWYVVVKGDYAGRVYGSVYDISNSTNPVPIPTSPAWTACQLQQQATVAPTTTAMRMLLQAYTQAHKVRCGARLGAGPGWQAVGAKRELASWLHVL